MAGNQKGQNDNRYLWPEFHRLVGELKPRWVVAENVPGILSISADTVCADLEREGYSVGIWDYEAAAVGARHRRERIFLWRTPDAHCDRGSVSRETFERRQKEGLPLTLNYQVAHMLPTPTANDAKNNNGPSRKNRHTQSLDAVAGGSLNPDWVSWLMGFPPGWTEID